MRDFPNLQNESFRLDEYRRSRACRVNTLAIAGVMIAPGRETILAIQFRMSFLQTIDLWQVIELDVRVIWMLG